MKNFITNIFKKNNKNPKCKIDEKLAYQIALGTTAAAAVTLGVTTAIQTVRLNRLTDEINELLDGTLLDQVLDNTVTTE